MDIFTGLNLLEFTERFQSDLDCKQYLAQLKWEHNFSCVKCSHTRAKVRKDLSRTCNICHHTESASANTLFHKCKFGLRKAFMICFEMATTTKSLSALQVAKRYTVTHRTARLFMHKVREAMKSSEKYPMEGNVQVDEFVLGGKETGKIGRSYDTKKKKTICAVELTDQGKVKRMYAQKIKDFSAESLRPLFKQHISPQASVRTDQWRGYGPLCYDYNIEQVPSEKGANFKVLHTMIHQVKSWIRTTYSWVSEDYIDRYYSEFCYRLNRSQSRNSIFHNLLKRMVSAEKLYHANMICT